MTKWITFYIGGLIFLSVFGLALAAIFGLVYLIGHYAAMFLLVVLIFGAWTLASFIWKRMYGEWKRLDPYDPP